MNFKRFSYIAFLDVREAMIPCILLALGGNLIDGKCHHLQLIYFPFCAFLLVLYCSLLCYSSVCYLQSMRFGKTISKAIFSHSWSVHFTLGWVLHERRSCNRLLNRWKLRKQYTALPCFMS